MREQFLAAREAASKQALWKEGDPSIPPDTCRYCGRCWVRWAGSTVDGHTACIVTDDFKYLVGDLLRSSPGMTYKIAAEAIGVTVGVVQSWAFSVGVAGPLTHGLRRGIQRRS